MKPIILLVISLLYLASACAADETNFRAILLVAKPGLPDPNFSQTVVLTLRPEDGSPPIGLVLNRRLDLRLSESVPEARGLPERFDALYVGGPVEPTGVWFLVRSAQQPLNAIRILDQVFFTRDSDVLQSVVRGELEVTSFRAYAGHSGWAPGQLENEITRGSWYVTSADADLIFAADPAKVWRDLNRSLDGLHTRSAPATLPTETASRPYAL